MRGRIRTLGRTAALVAIATSALSGAIATSATTALADTPTSWQDYNGDGFADLAIGVSGGSVSGHSGAGFVVVLYGSTHGLRSTGAQTWSQDSPGIGDVAAVGEGFGVAVTSGDFNGDGFGDLAIGVPEERIGSFNQAGEVHIIYGSSHGLTSAGSQILQNTATSGDGDLSTERFGASLVALDRFAPNHADPLRVGHDGIADLAVGVPSTGQTDGTYRLYPGRHSTFTGAFVERGCPDVATIGRCGLVLAAGKLDSDAIDDLAIGSPDAQNGGKVTLDLTAGGGLSSFSASALPAGPGLVGSFGASLAIGDMGGDTSSVGELVIGAPGETFPATPGPGNVVGAGAVYLLVGTNSGPSGTLVARITAADDDAPGDPGVGEGYGSSLAIADLGRGSGADLVIGASGDQVSGHDRAGSLVVLYGDKTRQRWNQDRTAILGSSAPDARYAAVLTVGNFGKGSHADLAIGAPRDIVSGRVAGAVAVMYGTPTGLTASNDQLWDLDSPGVPGTAHTFDRFGSALR